MYQNYPMYYGPNRPDSNRPRPNPTGNANDDRFVGGFVFPFLLGGVTGAALAPAFFRPGYGYNRPYYPPYPPYYGPVYYR